MRTVLVAWIMAGGWIAAFVLCLVLPLGCSGRTVDRVPANLMVTVEKEFVTRQSSYAWLPTPNSIISGNISGDFDFNGSGIDGDDVLVLAAVIVAAILVVEVVDISWHNLRGVRLSLIIGSPDDQHRYPLAWGPNRLHIPIDSLNAIGAGHGSIALLVHGTRWLAFTLPATTLKNKASVHTLRFAGDGSIVADGRVVKPVFPPPPPGRSPGANGPAPARGPVGH